ncbi:MAG: hypothetical protein KTR17_05525 [Cellvibrionaceae bacterium]|nr:hypothetical protein [Cellvibrionaceae bacterium]
MTFARCTAMAIKLSVVPSILVFSLVHATALQAQPLSKLTQQEMQYPLVNTGSQQYSNNHKSAAVNPRPSMSGIKYIPLKDTFNYTLYEKQEPDCETRELWLKGADGSIAVFEDDTGDNVVN